MEPRSQQVMIRLEGSYNSDNKLSSCIDSGGKNKLSTSINFGAEKLTCDSGKKLRNDSSG